MEENGLPYYGPSVEFSTVPALETQRILNYFNQFATSTVQMLNKFSVLCDTRLLQLDFKLQDVEATLAILEAKLASVPSLESTTIPVATTTSEILGSTPLSNSQPSGPTIQQSLPELPEAATPPVHQEAAAVAAPSLPPEVQRFAKMLAVGVPLMAVEQKMRAEGYDPSILSSVPGSNRAIQQRRESSSSEDTDGSSSSHD